MARAKSQRLSNPTDKQVITMPEAGSSLSMKKGAAPASPPTTFAPDLEGKIRQRAYELYEHRGCTPGFEQEDWFRAEREVLEGFGNHQQSA